MATYMLLPAEDMQAPITDLRIVLAATANAENCSYEVTR